MCKANTNTNQLSSSTTETSKVTNLLRSMKFTMLLVTIIFAATATEIFATNSTGKAMMKPNVAHS